VRRCAQTGCRCPGGPSGAGVRSVTFAVGGRAVVAVRVGTAGTGIGRGDYPAATANEEAGGQQANNGCEAQMRVNDGLLAAGDLTVVVAATLSHGPAVRQSNSEGPVTAAPVMWPTDARPARADRESRAAVRSAYQAASSTEATGCYRTAACCSVGSLSGQYVRNAAPRNCHAYAVVLSFGRCWKTNFADVSDIPIRLGPLGFHRYLHRRRQ
jgi:hypothetical protein